MSALDRKIALPEEDSSDATEMSHQSFEDQNNHMWQQPEIPHGVIISELVEVQTIFGVCMPNSDRTIAVPEEDTIIETLHQSFKDQNENNHMWATTQNSNTTWCHYF